MNVIVTGCTLRNDLSASAIIEVNIKFFLMILGCLLLSACDQRIGFRPLPTSIVEGHIEIRHDLGDPPSVIRGDFFEIGEELIFEFVIDRAENADLENLTLNWHVNVGSITSVEDRKANYTSACVGFEATTLTVGLDLSWPRLTIRQKATDEIAFESLSKQVPLEYFIRFNSEIVDGKVWYQYSDRPILDATIDTIYYPHFPVGIGYFDPVTGGEYIFPMTLSVFQYFSNIRQLSNVYAGFPIYDESGAQWLSIYNIGADNIWGTEDDLHAEKLLPFPGLNWPEEIMSLEGCSQQPSNYNPNTLAYAYFYISDNGVFAVPGTSNQDACIGGCSCNCWIGHYWLEPDGEVKQKFFVNSFSEQIVEALGLENTFNCNLSGNPKASDSIFFYNPTLEAASYLIFRHIGADKSPFSADDQIYFFQKDDLPVYRQQHFWDYGTRVEGGDAASFTQSTDPDQPYNCVNSNDCDAEIHFYHFKENGEADPPWSAQPTIVSADNAIDFNVSGDWISGYEKLATSPTDGIKRPYRIVIKNKNEVMIKGWASSEIIDVVFESAIHTYDLSMISWHDYHRVSDIDHQNNLIVYLSFPQECLGEDFDPFYNPKIDFATHANVIKHSSKVSLRYKIINE
jgi:hypothetical protein